MSSWPLRRKLIALVSIPMLVLIATGIYLGVQTAFNYASARKTTTLSELAISTVDTSITLRRERAAAIAVAETRGTPEGQTAQESLSAQTAMTDAAVAELRNTLSSPPSGGWPTRVAPAQQTALTNLDRLASIRGGISTRTPAAVDQNFDDLAGSIDNLSIATTTDLQSETRDTGTAEDAATLGALASIATSASQEQYRLRSALNAGYASVALKEQLLTFSAQQEEQFDIALLRASQAQGNQIAKIETADTNLKGFRTGVQSLPTDEGQADPKAVTANAFNDVAGPRITNLDSLAQDIAGDTLESARAVEQGEWIQAGLVVGLVLITLLSVALVLATIARSVTAPLRRLWTGAIDVASVQLPAAVQRIERDGVNADVSLPPVLPAGAAAGPETLEVARAVDDLGAEAVRLATAQVRLRRALDEAFVSMSRRSQSMVEKQLAIIDELERTEQDPDQLRNLFRLDHLAARMRRYNDNLLVLAGSAVRTRTTSPVKVAELFRAATSEMEHYERVRLQPVGGASIAGTVAGELIHLVAELLDNAAMYSPPTSPIVLSATVTVQGGLQLEIVDSGVGISPGELDRLNARLARPEGIDTQVPSRMGLFVVARLAQRGGFGVSLRPRPDANGSIAEVLVPPALVLGTAGRTGEHPVLGGTGQQRRPQSATPPAGLPTRATPARGAPVPASFPDPGRPAEVTAGGGRLPSRTRPAARNGRPAAAAAATAAATPAGITDLTTTTTARFSETPDAAPLPRRTRGGGSAPGAPATPLTVGGELWPEANGSDLVPLGGPDLFAANVPTGLEGTGESPVLETEAAPVTARTAPVEPQAPAARAQGPATGPLPVAATSATGMPSSLSHALRPVTPQTSPTGIPLSPLSPAGPAADPLPGATPVGTSPLSSWGSGSRARQSPLPGSAAPSEAARSLAQDPASFPSGDGTGPTPLIGDGGELPRRGAKNLANGANTAVPARGNGSAPAAWNDQLPAELAARAATFDRALIGSYDPRDETPGSSPIFDSISVWFDGEEDDGAKADQEQVIDLRDDSRPGSTSRWSTLGDQRWLATNARASAAPETAGVTDSGLPRRRPGANLLPSAATAGGPVTPAAGTPAPAPARPRVETAPVDRDADRVRGRLGSYQRGLATARQARPQAAERPAFEPAGASLFTASGGNDDAGNGNENPGGNR